MSNKQLCVGEQKRRGLGGAGASSEVCWSIYSNWAALGLSWGLSCKQASKMGSKEDGICLAFCLST